MRQIKLSLIMLFFGFQLSGQVNIQKILFENKNIDGKMLEIWHNTSTQPIPVVLVWLREDEQQGQHFVTLNPGKNKIILSSNPLWSGHIKALGSTDPNITANLIDITFIDQALAFFKPFSLTPGSINFATSNYLFDIALRYILLISAICFALLALMFKLNVRRALYVGFVCSALILLSQQLYQEYSIFNSYEVNNGSLQPFTVLVPFVKATEPILKNHPWTKTKLSGVLNSYVKYQFAEEEFIPHKLAQKSHFVISDKPDKNEVVVNSNGFYLTRK